LRIGVSRDSGFDAEASPRNDGEGIIAHNRDDGMIVDLKKTMAALTQSGARGGGSASRAVSQ